MSIITAIFQAIGQALTFILPISEWGHSSLFHDFAGRASGNCSALTGVVHIGIALGIVLSMYKIFLTLSKHFFATFKDIAKKNLKAGSQSNARKFMYMTLLSFVPMLLWVIPVGKNGLFFSLLHRTGFNSTLLDDGVFFALTGGLVLVSARLLKISKGGKNINILTALAAGVLSVLFVPVSGLSITAGVFAVLIIFGVSKKLALRYALVMSVPVLVVTGIVELFLAVTGIGIIPAIISVVVSAAVSFLAVRVLSWVISKNYLKYFGIYDLGIGAISIVIGAFELILK